ncbi:hypothetical protein [Magnetospirillum sp. UT-4]|uniref:hypothetical protein n=1 Tax=Magnetospirillum sp. UT-4 TaxID=2681467 RepID=UPI0013837D62|nr:hypothetical protein [Magnetospirillum sp. UT-4]CAA7626391.1 hypothetical protein MTBUT4_790003 [Magnetospirillum sp. UT-4]
MTSDPGKAVNIPRRWRDADAATRLWIYAQAIRELGEPLVFTLIFTCTAQDMMNDAEVHAVRYLAQRFRLHLPGIPYVFVAEMDKQGRLHIHGLVAAKGLAAGEIQTGLKRIVGDRRKVNGNQSERFLYDCISVEVKPPNWEAECGGRYGVFGWASYMGKDIDATRTALGAKPISRSRSVFDKAQEIFSDIAQYH